MTDRERVVLSLNAECCWMLTSQDLCLDGRHPGENVPVLVTELHHPPAIRVRVVLLLHTSQFTGRAKMCPEVPVEHVSVWPQ